MSESPRSLWQDYERRRPLYFGIQGASFRTRDNWGRRYSLGTVMREQGHAILRADEAFFNAMRLEKLAEREAVADSLSKAGKHLEASLVRLRPPPPEWRRP